MFGNFEFGSYEFGTGAALVEAFTRVANCTVGDPYVSAGRVITLDRAGSVTVDVAELATAVNRRLTRNAAVTVEDVCLQTTDRQLGRASLITVSDVGLTSSRLIELVRASLFEVGVIDEAIDAVYIPTDITKLDLSVKLAHRDEDFVTFAADDSTGAIAVLIKAADDDMTFIVTNIKQ